MLVVKNLEKWFNDHPALRNLSFTLNKGEIYALLGPNGAGKTTSIKIIAGLLSKDNGTISINNTDYHRNNSQLKKIISYVPDEPFVYTKLTGQEHMDFFADLYKVPRKVRKERFDSSQKSSGYRNNGNRERDGYRSPRDRNRRP